MGFFVRNKKAIVCFSIIAAAIILYFAMDRLEDAMDSISTVLGYIRPIIYGIMIAYLANPILNFFTRIIGPRLERKMKNQEKAKKLTKSICITVTMIVVLLLVAVLLGLIIPQLYISIVNIVDMVPRQYQKFMTWLQSYDDNLTIDYILDLLNRVYSYVQNWVNTGLLDTINSIYSAVMNGVVAVINFVVNILIAFVVAIYVLKDKEIFIGQSKKILYALFKPQTANRIIITARHGHRIFGGFLNARIIDSTIIGIICFIMLSIMRMPYVLLVSVVVGVTNIIPFFGPFIGGIPSALIILLDDPIKGLYFIIFIIILQQIDGNVISAIILGDTTGISEFWVTFALLLFGGLFGFTGMIIGVPLFAVIYFLIDTWLNQRLENRALPSDSEEYRNVSLFNTEEERFVELSEAEVDEANESRILRLFNACKEKITSIGKRKNKK